MKVLLRGKLICAACACLSLFLLTAGQAALAEVMTIDQAIEYALEHNPVVGMARENIEKSKAMVDQATSVGMPKLNAQGTYTRLDQVSEVSIGDRTVKLNELDSQAANLSLSQPIDVFGVIKTGKHAAKLTKASSQHEYDQAKNDTTLRVKEAYYAVLRAQQFMDVQQKRVEQLEAHLQETRLHLKAGTAAPFDVLRAETEVADAKQGLISAQNGVELAKAAFNNTLGRDLSAAVELDEPGPPQIVDLQLASCLDSACTNRPEVLKMQSQQALAQDMVHIARQGSKPQVNLNWQMNHSLSTTMFNPRPSSWTAYLTVSMPVFDGGKTRAAVNQAKADANSVKLGYDQTVLAVKLDTQQAYLSLNESREKISVAQKALEQARESMRLAQVRYKAGVSTQVEVFDAQTALTQAETNHVNAVYDYYTALAQLEKAVGGRTQMAKLTESALKVASESVGDNR